MSEHPYDELPGLLFGELNRAEVMVVSDHLAGCDECRRELAVLAAASASLRATARQAQPAAAPDAVPAPDAGGGRRARPGWRRRGRWSAWRPRWRWPWPRRRCCGRAGCGARTGPTGRSRWPGWAPWPPAAGPAWPATAATADDRDRRGPAHPGAGQYYEVWLLDPDAGTVFPVGVLPPDGEARFTLPASVVGRYQVIDVSLEADDGDPTHSKRSLLRGRYA